MLSVSALIHGTVSRSEAARRSGDNTAPGSLLHFSRPTRPIVVWNVTQRCNLHCSHCYASARDREYPGELTTAEGVELLHDLADFGVPAVLFSGGEPLTRPDLFELMHTARSLGMRTVLSTNGTYIGRAEAGGLKGIDTSYVGISLDGTERTHDHVRGRRGAFQEALAGIRACREQGLRVGLRVTIHRGNVEELPDLLKLADQEGIDRICVYHLAYAGRGAAIAGRDLDATTSRETVEWLFELVSTWRPGEGELLTVDNHADGPFLYLWLRERGSAQAREVAELLRLNGGNQSGVRLACIDPQGNVHPDQFSWHQTAGNVRDRPFSAIWSDPANPVLLFYRQRRRFLSARCRSCRFLPWCNGNLRVRAEHATGSIAGDDPACYLRPEETHPRAR